MKIDSFDTHDTSYLLRKIDWPEAHASLGYRIAQEAMMGVNYPNNGRATNEFWYIQSPILSVVAIIMAMFLGITSGAMTTNQASAAQNMDGLYSSGYSTSITNAYFGK
jgi:hypothetical protein